MKREEVERRLGFRATQRGVEILQFEDIRSDDEDPNSRIIMTRSHVRAVQPVLPKDHAFVLFELAVEGWREAALKKLERDTWSAKAFQENQDNEDLRKQLAVMRERAEAAEKEVLQLKSEGWDEWARPGDVKPPELLIPTRPIRDNPQA